MFRYPNVSAAPEHTMQRLLTRSRTFLAFPIIVASLFSVRSDAFAQTDEDRFMELSLEDLLNIDVTSVSKKSEKRSAARGRYIRHYER